MGNNTITLPAKSRPSGTEEAWVIQFRTLCNCTPEGKVVSAMVGRRRWEAGEETKLMSVLFGDIGDGSEAMSMKRDLHMVYLQDAGGETDGDAASAIADALGVKFKQRIDKNGKTYWQRTVRYPKPEERDTWANYDSDSSHTPTHHQGDPRYDRNENPWIDVYGEGDEAATAYWNTD